MARGGSRDTINLLPECTLRSQSYRRTAKCRYVYIRAVDYSCITRVEKAYTAMLFDDCRVWF